MHHAAFCLPKRRSAGFADLGMTVSNDCCRIIPLPAFHDDGRAFLWHSGAVFLAYVFEPAGLDDEIVALVRGLFFHGHEFLRLQFGLGSA